MIKFTSDARASSNSLAHAVEWISSYNYMGLLDARLLWWRTVHRSHQRQRHDLKYIGTLSQNDSAIHRLHIFYKIFLDFSYRRIVRCWNPFTGCRDDNICVMIYRGSIQNQHFPSEDVFILSYIQSHAKHILASVIVNLMFAREIDLGGISLRTYYREFPVCASISRVGIPLQGTDFLLDSMYSNKCYGA